MTPKYLFGATALAIVFIVTPATAQHAGQHGTHAPAAKKPAVKKETAKKPAATVRKPASKAKAKRRAAPATAPSPAPAVDHSKMDHSTMDQGSAPAGEAPPGPAPIMPVDHSRMDHGTAGQSASPEHGEHRMTGALGSYPMTREASGTAWQPDTGDHLGVTARAGGWDLMGHGVLNLVHDRQEGPRGDRKTFVSGMVMGMARRPVGNGTVQLRASVSPDPLMGRRGYPLLLASGETADGETRLIDRQHPHDFFMELSGSLSQNIGARSSIFVYAGLPGEPAFGPPAFMHREAIMDSPEAPISHHWLDSTHISFGVVTAGLVLDRFKVEASRFNGREPDERRWNIETGPLDSTAVRLSWNPLPQLALQGSWGHFKDSEQLEPGVDQKRWSASALYARELRPGLKFAGTLAWGRKTIEDHKDDAFSTEASLKTGRWTVFARGEIAENRELLDAEEHGPAYRVGKVSVGAVRDFRIAEHVKLGAGGLVAVNFVPDGLSELYGDRNPLGAMAFLRLKVE